MKKSPTSSIRIPKRTIRVDLDERRGRRLPNNQLNILEALKEGEI